MDRAIYRGLAATMLDGVFGAEWHRVDNQSIVIDDFIDASAKDSNMSASEYKRCIGDGNLLSYVRCLEIQA